MGGNELNFVLEIVAIDDERIEILLEGINKIRNIFDSNTHDANSLIEEFFFMLSNLLYMMLVKFQYF